MASLSEIAGTVNNQNQAVAAQAAAPPPVEAEKPAPQAADEAKREAQLEHQQTTEDRKAERKAKLDGLRQLSQATQQKFTESQALRSEREKVTGEIAAIRAEMARVEKERNEARQELDAAKKNPMPWLQGQGVKLRALAEQVAKEDTPDAKVEALQKALVELGEKNERKIAELQAQYDQAIKEAAERETKAAMQAQNARMRAEFLECVEKNKDKWPHLMKATKGVTERVIREFMITFEDVKADPKTGPYIADYSNEELLDATNMRLREMGVYVDDKPAVVAGKATETKPALTTSTAVEPQALPMDFKRLSPKEQIKAMASQYKANRKS